MTVTFYNCSDDERVINKTVSDGVTVEARPYEGCSVLQPSLILEYNADILSRNYAYIPEWKRYYYVGNASVEIGNRMVIPLRVDPLKSWEESIRNVPLVAERSTNAPNSMIIDPDRDFSSDSVTEYHELGTFSDSQIYLLGVS